MGLVEKAFEQIDRKDFVPQLLRNKAAIDIPLPIGFGQTISQPSTVRNMLTWLDARPGEKVLDVGSGSGWTSALISVIVGPKGIVYAVEIIPELVEFGRKNCKKIGVENVRFCRATQTYGLPSHSPFDRILVSAAAKKLPIEFIDQLKIGGKLVIPVKNDILEITKKSESAHEITAHPGYIFVPLILLS